jgi:hypothetical protein
MGRAVWARNLYAEKESIESVAATIFLIGKPHNRENPEIRLGKTLGDVTHPGAKREQLEIAIAQVKPQRKSSNQRNAHASLSCDK